MAGVGRYVKMTARVGKGDALAGVLLRVADSLKATPGCELYLINRSALEPDVVWVTELWLGQDALDTSLQALESDAGKAQLAEVMALLDGPPERIDIEPLGGAGYLAGGTGATVINLNGVEDQAPKFGLGELGEARFATRALQATRTGVSLHRLNPGMRQAFGHSHHHAEEVYVVLAGSGRVRIDDEIQEVRRMDAIRIAPESMRAFEAGPDGIEFLAVGPHLTGDAEMAPEFWKSEA